MTSPCSRKTSALAFFLIVTALSLVAAGSHAHAQSSSGSDMFSFLTEGKFDPFLEGDYGYAVIDHKNFTADLPATGSVGLKLGFREIKRYKDWGKKLDERFALGYYAKSTFPFGKSGTGDLYGEWWRAGVGQRSGYGWDILGMILIPYHQYSFNVAGMKFNNTGALTPADTALLSRVMGNTRLAFSTEGGATVQLFSFLGASAGYEASIIYPRFVFPQWITSYLLLGSSVVIISEFADEIVSSSPVLGPILYFVLRNAVAYGFFYAYRGEMNWPFKSETPFMTHNFKIDVSLKF